MDILLADQLDAGSGDLFILEVDEGPETILLLDGKGYSGKVEEVGVGVGDRGGGVHFENLLFLS